jgi:hypothetical protein
MKELARTSVGPSMARLTKASRIASSRCCGLKGLAKTGSARPQHSHTATDQLERLSITVFMAMPSTVVA